MRSALLILCCAAIALAGDPPVTTWVGNTYAGAGDNGFGAWVQNGVGRIAVSPEGTILAGCKWDEGGRCLGLYRNNKVNERIVAQYDMKGGHEAWGWGSANEALAVDGGVFYAINTEGDLIRWRWTPGDLDSHGFDQQAKGSAGGTIALAARAGVLALLRGEGAIELRAAADLATVTATWKVKQASDLAFARDGTLWILSGDMLLHRKADGSEAGPAIAVGGKPSALAVDPKGRLVVCDDGPRQQVLVFDPAKPAKPVQTIGRAGGLSVSKGKVGPEIVFSPRGANFDADGNLHIAMGFGGPGGNTVLRTFAPSNAAQHDGKQLHEYLSLAFVDVFDPDVASDGTLIYGVDEIMTFDPKAPAGQGWTLRAITLDHITHPDDPRIKKSGGSTGIIRTLKGKRILYTIGQYSDGVQFFSFDGDIAIFAGKIGSGWACEVDSQGAIWATDEKQERILRWTFNDWGNDGKPQFDAVPQSWPRPAGLIEISRLVYDPAFDVLYIGGATDQAKPKSWGLAGAVLERHNGWSSGTSSRAWQVPLPLDGELLQSKSIALAGDYIFAAAVKPSDGINAKVTALKTSDGSVAATWGPGEEVGRNSGWIDTSHGLRAMRCKDGSYLVVVEENHRGKNLIYRWK